MVSVEDICEVVVMAAFVVEGAALAYKGDVGVAVLMFIAAFWVWVARSNRIRARRYFELLMSEREARRGGGWKWRK